MAGGKKVPKSKQNTNGTTTPAVQTEETKGPPVVVGISFGDSYASISVVNKASHITLTGLTPHIYTGFPFSTRKATRSA